LLRGAQYLKDIDGRLRFAKLAVTDSFIIALIPALAVVQLGKPSNRARQEEVNVWLDEYPSRYLQVRMQER